MSSSKSLWDSGSYVEEEAGRMQAKEDEWLQGDHVFHTQWTDAHWTGRECTGSIQVQDRRVPVLKGGNAHRPPSQTKMLGMSSTDNCLQRRKIRFLQWSFTGYISRSEGQAPGPAVDGQHEMTSNGLPRDVLSDFALFRYTLFSSSGLNMTSDYALL